MNETTNTKATAIEVAGRLANMANGLMNGKFMSIHDISHEIDRLANKLKYALFADKDAENAPTDAERLRRFRSIPEAGVEFKRFFSPRIIRLVGVFVNPAGDKNQNHVYELLVKESANHPGRWIAKATVDGREIFTLTSASKWKAERCGFGALKSWLLRALRKTIKASKKKEGK